jgi:hypothetical protein
MCNQVQAVDLLLRVISDIDASEPLNLKMASLSDRIKNAVILLNEANHG